ncbi:MAG: putative toxin-antitoxin system toxin component, PIN family [Lewinellaceae bacterium]|nr:putative toxin-antitoxin system toxin component, PIN family [Lewinellaceae bacterium]
MRVVIDTNVLLVSISTKSRYRPIFDALLEGKYQLAISNEILSEYMEVLERKANATVATNIAEALLNSENVIRTEIFFSWGLIKEDEDDNKFVDCAIAANAKYLVSNDKHFRILQEVEFPKVDVVGIEEFLESLRE